jgi:hypothetical protein
VVFIVFVSQPGIHDTSCARWPSGNDFGCGFHCPLSVGTRSSTLRVGPISWSNSRAISAMIGMLTVSM